MKIFDDSSIAAGIAASEPVYELPMEPIFALADDATANRDQIWLPLDATSFLVLGGTARTWDACPVVQVVGVAEADTAWPSLLLLG